MKALLAFWGASFLLALATDASADESPDTATDASADGSTGTATGATLKRRQARRPDALPSNEFGGPVRTPGGVPITYDRAESEAQVALLAPPPLPASATEGPFDVAPTVTATYAAFGTGIGLSGISSAFVGGRTEIYAGASGATFGGNGYWYALTRDAETGNYDMVYVSPLYASGIVRLDVADVRAEPGPEIVALLTDGTVEVRSAESKQVLASFPSTVTLPFFGGGGLRFFDRDGDGLAEIWVSGESRVRALDGEGHVTFSKDGVGGSDLVIAQMDADAAPELATADGKVVDTATGVVQCSWAEGFGFRLAASDFDHDGKHELVFSEPWGFAWGFDADTCLPKWSLPVFNVGAMAVLDANGDGTDELVLGDAQWGDLHAHSLTTQQELWTIANPEHGTTWVTAVDADGDGDTEVLWGSGASSSGADRLYVGDPAAEAIVWQNVQLEGPFLGPRLGDVDGDGTPELVTVSTSSDSGYGAGCIVVLDAQTLRVKAVSQPVAQGYAWTGMHDLKLRNVDADPALEIVTASDRFYDGLIEIHDYAATGPFPLAWDNQPLPDGATFHAVEVGDIDGDGRLDVVAGADQGYGEYAGVYTYVYDFDTGALKWHSLHMGGQSAFAVTDLALADSDNDGRIEIHAMASGGSVYVFDGVTKELNAIVGSGLRAIDVRPEPGRKGLNLWAGDASGKLSAYAWNGSTYALRGAFQLVTGGPLTAFSFGASGGIYAASDGSLSFRPTLASPPAWALSGWGSNFGQSVTLTSPAPTFVTSNNYAVLAFGPP